MTAVTRLDGGPFGVGSQNLFKQPKLGTMLWTVTELSAGHSFVRQAERPGLTLRQGHYLNSRSADTVDLTLTVEQKGLVGRLLEPLIGKRDMSNSKRKDTSVMQKAPDLGSLSKANGDLANLTKGGEGRQPVLSGPRISFRAAGGCPAIRSPNRGDGIPIWA